MLDLWLKILDILDRMMNSGQADTLEEAVPESLKNILLVMANGGYLVEPPPRGTTTGGEEIDEGKIRLWTETQKRLERFVPGLWNELFPPSAPSVQETSREQPPPQQQQQEEGKEGNGNVKDGGADGEKEGGKE